VEWCDCGDFRHQIKSPFLSLCVKEWSDIGNTGLQAESNTTNCLL